MKKIRILVVVWLLLFAVMSQKTQANQQGIDRDWINGPYQVVIKAGHYAPYSTDIKITSINSETVKIIGDFNGLPITVSGKIKSSQSSGDTAVYDFKTHNDLFSGHAVITFKKKGERSYVSGNGSGIYNYMGETGTGSGTFTGTKTSLGSDISWLIPAALISTSVLILFLWWRKGRTSVG